MGTLEFVFTVGLVYSVYKLLSAITEYVKTKLQIKIKVGRFDLSKEGRIDMVKDATPRILTWDYKDDAPLHEINRTLEDVTNGINCPGFQEVDTESDTVAVVIASHRISTEQAQEIWDTWIKDKTVTGGKLQ